MSEKIYVRKCERYTVWDASEPVEVDIEKLRKCEPPYTGETNEDLLNYLTDNVRGEEDWCDNETNKEVYGEDESFDLILQDCDMESYSDTRNNSADEWLDIGIPNDDYRKMGRFEVKVTNV